jgi:hypothetical protein
MYGRRLLFILQHNDQSTPALWSQLPHFHPFTISIQLAWPRHHNASTTTVCWGKTPVLRDQTSSPPWRVARQSAAAAIDVDCRPIDVYWGPGASRSRSCLLRPDWESAGRNSASATLEPIALWRRIVLLIKCWVQPLGAARSRARVRVCVCVCHSIYSTAALRASLQQPNNKKAIGVH